MSTHNYLDKTGLGQVWEKIKERTDVFLINITATTENGETTYSADKTFTQIYDAYQDGKKCVVNYGWGEPTYFKYYYLDYSDSNEYLYFISLDGRSLSVSNENIWYYDGSTNANTADVNYINSNFFRNFLGCFIENSRTATRTYVVGNYILQRLNESSTTSTFLRVVSPISIGDSFVAAGSAKNVETVSLWDILDEKYGVKSDWSENDSTASSYIENRTHYLSGQSNTIEIDFSDFLKDKFSIGVERYPRTYESYTYDMYLSCYVDFGNDASYDNELVYFDYTVSSMQMILNGTTYSLLFDAEDVDEDWPYGYLYNEHIRIDLDWHYVDDDYTKYCSFGSIYFNDDYLKVGDELKLIVPLTQPINTYNKLNSNYLDGKLICRGAGSNSEVFNYTSKNVATGIGSHAEGWSTTASGAESHAEGSMTVASGSHSHAECYGVIASGDYSHAEGTGQQVFTFRFNCEAGSNILNIVTPPNLPSYITFTDLINLHAKAGDSFVKDITVENNELKTIILYEPYPYERNNYTGYLFIQQIAGSASSHIEGSDNIINTSGSSSHVEGNNNYTNGRYSHVEGYGNVCLTDYQHVQGKYNEIDTQNKYAHIVGNGTYNARSNAHTLDWNGNGWYAGKLTVGAAPTDNMDVATKSYVDNAMGSATTTISGLTDTTITSVANGDVLIYDSTSSKWINSNLTTIVNTAVATALAEYGDGDTASYGFLDGNEVSY